MNGNKIQPIIYQYLKKYQENPASRVFAPLAEAYRKAGLVDEAIEIAEEGLKVHPQFVGGRVALARALFDKKLYEKVAAELTPVIRDVPDNLVAQRLLADSCLILGRVAEAISAYKMLLYFSPHDMETNRVVQELETKAYEKGALILRVDAEPLPPFDVRKLSEVISSDPNNKKVALKEKIEKLLIFLQKIERYRVMQVR